MPVSSPPVANNATLLQVDSPPPRPDTYRQFLPVIGELIAKKDFEGLVRVAEMADIQVYNDHSPSRLLTVTPLVLGFLIRDDFASARYAMVRQPDAFASFPPFRSLMMLVIATAHRQYSKVYEHIDALHRQASSTEFPDKDLGLVITTMVPILLESFRNRALALLSKAYTSLPVPLASVYLGISPEEIMSGVDKFGWSLDPASQVLHSASRKPVLNVSGPSSKSSLGTFSIIAESVAKLEA
jgi:COP9 signalosome complex subunit 8